MNISATHAVTPSHTVKPRSYKYLVNAPDRNPSDVLELNEAAVSDNFIVRNESTNQYYIFSSYHEFKLWFDNVSPPYITSYFFVTTLLYIVLYTIYHTITAPPMPRRWSAHVTIMAH